MTVGDFHIRHIPTESIDLAEGRLQTGLTFWRCQMRFDDAADFIFHFGRVKSVLTLRRRQQALILGLDHLLVDVAKADFRIQFGSSFGGNHAEDPGCANKSPAGGGDIAGSIKVFHRGFGVFIDKCSGWPMPTTHIRSGQGDFDQIVADVDAAHFKELLLCGSLGRKDAFLDNLNRFFGQVAQVVIDRAASFADLGAHCLFADTGRRAFQHVRRIFRHEPLAERIDQMAAMTDEGGMAGAFIIFEHRRYIVVFHIDQFATCVVNHRVPFSGIVRAVKGAEQVAGVRQGKAALTTGAEDDRFGPADLKFAGANVEQCGADGAAVLGQNAAGHRAVQNPDSGPTNQFLHHRFDVAAHFGQKRAAGMKLLHHVLAVFITGKACDSQAFQFLQDAEAFFGDDPAEVGVDDSITHQLD